MFRRSVGLLVIATILSPALASAYPPRQLESSEQAAHAPAVTPATDHGQTSPRQSWISLMEQPGVLFVNQMGDSCWRLSEEGQRLSDLLEEHSLSVSGAISEKSAVEIGNLIGVEGFIDGYASIEDRRLILSFSLIESTSGVIVWTKTFERPLLRSQ